MITRIHKRGTSFKTAIAYILHDPNKVSKDRVDWAFSVNCGNGDVAEAWRPMVETWDRRTALKREAGVDLRGADNKAPVMHYTLSWAPGDHPSKQQMMDAALKSLKALGLEHHQAAIAAHNDKDHLHVHIVVNTVDPTNGRTANLKFPALALREFAREQERERAAYDAAREAAAQKLPPYKRNNEAREKAMALLRPNPMIEKLRPAEREPHHRRRALEKSDVIDRMRRHRAENDKLHMVEKDVLWAVHRAERDDLYRCTQEASQVALEHVRDRFKSRWRDLYKAQRDEWKHVERIQANPLERAVYVFVNSERLGNGRPLTMRETAALVASPAKLFKAVERVHTRERRGMAQIEKVETKERLDRVWRTHDVSFANLKAEQDSARAKMRAEQQAHNKRSVSYYRAEHELESERRGLIPERHAEGASPFETDAMYVTRARREIDTHYRRQYGADSVPFIPWNAPTRPAPIPEATAEPTPEQDADREAAQEAERARIAAERRRRERDFDHGL